MVRVRVVVRVGVSLGSSSEGSTPMCEHVIETCRPLCVTARPPPRRASREQASTR